MGSAPNSGALTCDQASQKAAATGDLSCEELDEANADARDNQLEPGLKAEGYALTTAVYKPKQGPAKLLKACSSADGPLKDFKDGFEKPISHWKRPDCSGGGGYDAMRRNDSETKILDPLARAGSGGSIKMKIYHQVDATSSDQMPCISCRKSICGAQECGITVTLCNNKNEEVPAAEMCEGAKPKGTGSTKDPHWVSKGFA